MSFRISSAACGGLLMVLAVGPAAAAPAKSAPNIVPFCQSPRAEDQAGAAEVERFVRARWMQDGRNWYMAFQIKPSRANPFDVQAPKQPPAELINGVVWARRLSCKVIVSENPPGTRYRISAIVISFNEGLEWSFPQRGALLIDLLVRREGDQWLVTDQSAESGVLLPEMVQRLPQKSEIPPPSEKFEVPCVGAQQWNGKRCVGRASIAQPLKSERKTKAGKSG